jgi:hypothetical protein
MKSRGLFVLLILLLLPALWLYNRPRPPKCPGDPDRCPAAVAGVVQPIATLVRPGVPNSDKTRLPCNMIGVWMSTKYRVPTKVTLMDDGSYIAQAANRPGAPLTRGLWAVQGNTMIWLHATSGYQSGNRPDINPIVLPSDGKFVLEEMDGSFTPFELIEAVKSTHCAS